MNDVAEHRLEKYSTFLRGKLVDVHDFTVHISGEMCEMHKIRIITEPSYPHNEVMKIYQKALMGLGF